MNIIPVSFIGCIARHPTNGTPVDSGQKAKAQVPYFGHVVRARILCMK